MESYDKWDLILKDLQESISEEELDILEKINSKEISNLQNNKKLIKIYKSYDQFVEN